MLLHPAGKTLTLENGTYLEKHWPLFKFLIMIMINVSLTGLKSMGGVKD